MRTVHALLAAGRTDPGRQRAVNEDRFHCDAARGLFMVIDGIGGQAAGGKAADVALSTLRGRLERETGSASDRVREAITLANNEIVSVAGTRPQWSGMACVLTVAIIDDGRLTIGHVGDTRLYKLRNARIEKVTRDHSPVGEREDAKELSESEAMRHPRRNEVYRAVGSELHEVGDPEFIDVDEIPFEPDAALLLCSDGLSDLIDSATIADVVSQCVGDPETVTQALVEMANLAGGKDNVTVVYAEGEKFAASLRRYPIRRENVESPLSRRHTTNEAKEATPAPSQGKLVRDVIFAILFLAVGFGLARLDSWTRSAPSTANVLVSTPSKDQVVQSTESIAAAVARAVPGSQIIVDPGEYRERVFLKDGVRLVSRVPRGATIRLPSTTSDSDFVAAVVADHVSHAELTGFKIIGDAATPLGVGVGITDSDLALTDVEIVGATKAGIEFGENSSATLLGSEIHDNPGAAIFVSAHANPRITNNVFSRNGMSERSSGSFMIDAVSRPVFQQNVFVGLSPDAFLALDEAARSELSKLNWFPTSREPVRPSRSGAGGRQSRP